MRIVRMVGGEIIRDRYIRSRFQNIGPGKFDITASRYFKRLERLLDRRGDFVERYRHGDAWCRTTNTGDNCLKVYPEGLVL